MHKNSIGFEIATLSNIIKREINNFESKKHMDKLTRMHGWVIGYIKNNANNKDIFQKDLEKEFSIRRSTASGILKLMEKNGLILREPVGYDARLKKLSLTQNAFDIDKAFLEDVDEVEERLTRNFTSKEKEIIFKLIKKMKSNLEE